MRRLIAPIALALCVTRCATGDTPDTGSRTDASHSDVPRDAAPDVSLDSADIADTIEITDATPVDTRPADFGQLGTLRLDGASVTVRTNPCTNYRGVDAAYDPTHRVFLVAYGNAPIGGAFFDDDGTQLGDGFRLTDAAYDGSNWTQLPRVAYGDGEFLVTWHGVVGTDVVVQARRVRYDGTTAAFDGPSVAVNTPNSMQESPPSVAFSPASHEFVVVWAQNGIKARRVGIDGATRGDVIIVSPDGVWAEQPSIVFHPGANAFFVAYAQADSAARVGLARIADGTGQLVTTPRDLTGDSSFSKVTDVEYDDAAGEVIASYFLTRGGVSGFFAQRFRADGEPAGTEQQIFAPYGSYDGYDLAYSPATGTSLAAFHGPAVEDFGGELDPMLVSGPVAAITAGGAASGTFIPHVVAHPTRPFWLVFASADYTRLIAQRVAR